MKNHCVPTSSLENSGIPTTNISPVLASMADLLPKHAASPGQPNVANPMCPLTNHKYVANKAAPFDACYFMPRMPSTSTVKSGVLHLAPPDATGTIPLDASPFINPPL